MANTLKKHIRSNIYSGWCIRWKNLTFTLLVINRSLFQQLKMNIDFMNEPDPFPHIKIRLS